MGKTVDSKNTNCRQQEHKLDTQLAIYYIWFYIKLPQLFSHSL